MAQILKIALGALLLAACTEFGDSRDDLTSKTVGAVAGPDCASCHAYPLRDTNHVYHLFESSGSIVNDRPITCLHCHNRSIASHMETFVDSIFLDSNGNEFHGLDFPDDQELRTFPLVRIDTFSLRRPLPAPAREGVQPELREWVTSLAHMNGTVDVEFNPTSHDTARFKGASAAYNPTKETCSAVACHPTDGDYRFADSARGLTELLGDSL